MLSGKWYHSDKQLIPLMLCDEKWMIGDWNLATGKCNFIRVSKNQRQLCGLVFRYPNIKVPFPNDH